MRNLKNKSGATLQAPSWFAKLRDNKPLPAAEQSQKARYDAIFKSLDKAGIARNSLYEAWDFTVDEPPEPQLADAPDPQQRLQPARRHQPRRRPARRARAPPFTVDSTTPNPAPGIAQ